VLALFVLGTYVVLMAYNGEVSAYVNPPEWTLLLTLTALSLLVVLVFRGKSRRTADYTLLEEALLGLAFLGALLAFRGLRGSVPLLFGLGLAALFAWATLQVVRLVARRETRMQRVVLKREGRFTLAGVVFAAVMLLAFSGLALSWREQASLRNDGKATMTRLLLEQGHHRLQSGDTQEAVRIFERALQFDANSIEARRGLAFALCRDDRLEEGLQEFERVLAARPDDAETHAQMGAALLARRDVERALPHVREAVRLAPERPELHLFLADVLEAMGQSAEAARERAAAQVSPGSAPR
jgi:Tfp pilus assembly protein PilF